MNDRLVTLLGAMAALLLLAGLLFQPSEPARFGKPTSEQQGPQGYFALFHWLQRSQVPVVSLRERMTELDRFAEPGNILLLTLPTATALRSREVRLLNSWVGRGNTLLLMAALNDTPSWTSEVDRSRFFEDLEDLTNLRFAAVDTDEDEGAKEEVEEEQGLTLSDIEALFAKQEFLLLPSQEPAGSGLVHPLFQQVDELHAVSDAPSTKWETVGPCNPCDADEEEQAAEPNEPAQLVLALAEDSRTKTPAFWALSRGEGRVLLSGVSDLFSNRSLGSEGNSRLLSNIIAWHLGPQGQFIVDDMHQGLSVLYDPEAFYKDPRLGYSILFLLAFWLLYLVGSSNRLAPVVPMDDAPVQGDYVAAVGGFMSRKLAPADTALLLFERWLAELEARLGNLGADASQAWEQLLALPTVDPDLVSSLQSLHSDARQGRPVNIADLHNQLQQMRKQIG